MCYFQVFERKPTKNTEIFFKEKLGLTDERSISLQAKIIDLSFHPSKYTSPFF